MNDEAKFAIKTQAESVTGKQLLVIAVVSAAVIAFLALFTSIPLTIGLFKLNIIAEPESKGGQMKMLGMVYLVSWAVCYIGFMLKLFWNMQKALRGVENTKSEGEYSFFDDHFEAELNGNRRRMRYSEILKVENRDNSAFAFLGPDAMGIGTEEIAFGLSKAEIKFKKGENYWMHIRSLIEKKNPACEFLDVVRGSKSIAKRTKKRKKSVDAPRRVGAPMKFMFVFVGAMFIFAGLLLYQMGAETSGWPVAEGKITSSLLGGGRSSRHSNRSSSSMTYGANICYEFFVGDQKHLGTRVSYGDSSSSFKGHGTDIVERYPVGKKVTVHYDPKNPKIAVLETGAPVIAYGLMGAGLLIASFPWLIALFRRKPVKSMEDQREKTSQKTDAAIEYPVFEEDLTALKKMIEEKPSDLFTEIELADDGVITIFPRKNAEPDADEEYERIVIGAKTLKIYRHQGTIEEEVNNISIADIESVEWRSAMMDSQHSSNFNIDDAPRFYVRISYKSTEDERERLVAIGVGTHSMENGLFVDWNVARYSLFNDAEAKYIADLVKLAVHERWKSVNPKKYYDHCVSMADKLKYGNIPSNGGVSSLSEGRLRVEDDGNTLRLWYRPGLWPLGCATPFWVVGLILVSGPYLWTMDSPAIFYGCVLLFPAFLITIWKFTGRMELTVSEASIMQSTSPMPKRNGWIKEIPLEDVSQTVVENMKNSRREKTKYNVLRIESKNSSKSILFGVGLSLEELEWAKDAINAAIAKLLSK